MEVQILCKKLIKPSAPTPPHLRILKLSPIGQAYPVKTAVLLYYSADGSTGTDGRSINLLESSLSETLNDFYPLAGRYVIDGNWVDCNDEGVEFFVGKVKGCGLRQFLSRRDEMIDQLSRFVGGASASSIASVQINMFDCGGLVIAVSISHRLFDGFSAANFITSWASSTTTTAITRHGGGDDGGREVIKPIFDLSSILPLPLPAKDLDLSKMKPVHPFVGLDKTVTRRLVFDKAVISALRGRAYDPSFPRKPSRVEVVTALIWRALMRVSRAKHGRLRTSVAAHSVNLRPRIFPPLPPGACENFQCKVTTRFVAAEAESGGGDREVPVPELKYLVGLLMDSFAKSRESVLGREEVYPTLLRTRNELDGLAGEKGELADVLMFTSWCRIPFYQVDFGWGKPVWVSRIPLPYESTTLIDTEDGEGIEAWLCFNKKDMPLFLRDEDMLAFIPPFLGNPGGGGM